MPVQKRPTRKAAAADRSRKKAPAPPPENDLATLAGQIPAEILRQLAAAIRAGHWLFAVWTVSEGTIHLDRTATRFPTADLKKAVQMLEENLRDLTPDS